MLSKKILRIKYELVGLENIPKDRFFLLASNHQSAWETFFFSFFFNKSAFILKKELRKVPLISRYFKKLGFIFIDRDNGFQSIKKIINSINRVKEKGVKVIIIFPEGTRTPINKVGNINAGVFAIHKLLKIPVLVVKHNSGKYWRNKKFIKRPGKIKLEIFPIIEKIEKKEVFIETINKLFYYVSFWYVSKTSDPKQFEDIIKFAEKDDFTQYDNAPTEVELEDDNQEEAKPEEDPFEDITEEPSDELGDWFKNSFQWRA